MQLLYKIFYFLLFNLIIRSILRPFRSSISSKFKIPINGIISVKTEKNQKIYFTSNETCPMAKILFWEDRGCTFEFSIIFKELVKNSRSFLDIGANVGYYSLLGKTINPNLNVIAFEPSKGPKYFFKENVKLNNQSSIILVEKALGDSDGEIDFYEEKNQKYLYREHHASGIGNTINSWGIENFTKYKVELTTLNNIIEQLNITDIDLIKIDTEGTEDRIFIGGLEQIIKNQPIIICEVLEGKIEDQIQDIIVNKLQYNIFQFQSKSNKLKEIKIIKDENHNHESNYFFVPTSKIHLIKQFIS